MLHFYAALAAKEPRLISERTKTALGVKRGPGREACNPGDIRAAGELGRQALTIAADQFARDILPCTHSSPGGDFGRSVARHGSMKPGKA